MSSLRNQVLHSTANDNHITMNNPQIELLDFGTFKKRYQSLGVTPLRPTSLPGALDIWFEHIGNRKDSMFVLSKGNSADADVVFPFIRKESHKGAIRSWASLHGPETWHSDIHFSGHCNLENIASFLVDSKKQWDFIKIVFLPAELMKSLKVALNDAAIPFIEWQGCYSSVIYKDMPFDVFTKTQCNAGSVKEVRRLLPTHDKNSKYSIREYRTATEVQEGLQLAYEISGRSWKAQQDTHIGADNNVGKYYRDLFQWLSSQNMLSVNILFYDRIPASFMIVSMFNGSAFMMKADYDERFKKQCAGSVVFFLSIASLFKDDGVKKLDFISDFDYLRAWTPRKDKYDSVIIFNRSIKSKVVRQYVKYILPLARRIHLQN